MSLRAIVVTVSQLDTNTNGSFSFFFICACVYIYMYIWNIHLVPSFVGTVWEWQEIELRERGQQMASGQIQTLGHCGRDTVSAHKALLWGQKPHMGPRLQGQTRLPTVLVEPVVLNLILKFYPQNHSFMSFINLDYVFTFILSELSEWTLHMLCSCSRQKHVPTQTWSSSNSLKLLMDWGAISETSGKLIRWYSPAVSH